MSDYYTAEEAMKILGKSRATFYREVDAGLIPYELPGGKKRGRQFPKEAIDLHAKLQKEIIKSTFIKSTNVDLWQRIQNSRRIYGNNNVISYRRALEWQAINDNIFMSMKINNELVGGTTIMPLREDIILKLVRDEIIGRDIPDEAIKQWDDPHLSAYIATIAIIPSGNKRVDREHGATLLRHTIGWGISLQQQYDIQSWNTIGVTPEGQKIAEFLGFKEIYSNSNSTKKGYKLSRDEFQTKYITRLINKQEELHRLYD
jgi:hypothetical protein